MDSKVTLRFDKDVIEEAKAFAKKNNISLSRFIELLLRKAVSSPDQAIDKLPVSDWVRAVAEGEPTYVRKPRSGKSLKKEFFHEKKKK